MSEALTDDELLSRLAGGGGVDTSVAAALKESMRRNHRQRQETAYNGLQWARRLWVLLVLGGRHTEADLARAQLTAYAKQCQELLVTGFFTLGLRHEPE
jgi:hypothetical protein